MRLHAVPDGVAEVGADLHVENAARYRDVLRRLD
jgi:hypothetical protein